MTKPDNSNSSSKKEQVRNMFNSIAPSYIRLNTILSAGIDKIWRKKAVRFLSKKLNTEKPLIADIACGTADFSLELMKLKKSNVIGLDISENMLEEGRKVVVKKQFDSRIRLEVGDAEDIHYRDGEFDAAVCGFGVRNFENLEKGLSEICRIIKQDSYFVILEFSEPKIFPIKQIYNFYSNKILPLIGKMISKDETAYTYLPNSIKAFKKDEELCKVLKSAGFSEANYQHLSLGIVSLYTAKK